MSCTMRLVTLRLVFLRDQHLVRRLARANVGQAEVQRVVGQRQVGDQIVLRRRDRRLQRDQPGGDRLRIGREIVVATEEVRVGDEVRQQMEVGDVEILYAQRGLVGLHTIVEIVAQAAGDRLVEPDRLRDRRLAGDEARLLVERVGRHLRPRQRFRLQAAARQRGSDRGRDQDGDAFAHGDHRLARGLGKSSPCLVTGRLSRLVVKFSVSRLLPACTSLDHGACNPR